jgi:hypothetical protein
LAATLWFIPTVVYRFSLKSTAWFWWPLAYISKKPIRANDPDILHVAVLSSLWARARIALSVIVLCSFIFVNVLPLPLQNPFLTPLGLFLIAKWDIPWWQVLSLVISVIGIIVVLWLDFAYRIARVASSRNDERILRRARIQIEWVERLIRLRNVLTILFWLVVGFHGSLYVNAQNCSIAVPDYVQDFAVVRHDDPR